MLFGAGCLVAGFFAVFFFFFVAAYALSKLPTAGRMTAAPNAAIVAATISFFTGSLRFVGIAEDRPRAIWGAIRGITEDFRY
jgi:hypothetical protein